MIVVCGVKRMDWKDREGSEDTRYELKIAKWYDTGNVKRNGEITFFSARGQVMKYVLNIQTATNEGFGKAQHEVEGEVEQFRNS
jgi:GH15 family glucan-1,4-alpha-glucosidase